MKRRKKIEGEKKEEGKKESRINAYVTQSLINDKTKLQNTIK